jgi:hypothetical protein
VYDSAPVQSTPTGQVCAISNAIITVALRVQMTIAIAWTRRGSASSLQEMVVASDSRLSSAGHVDICQKIFPLDRGDSFLAFCGDTTLAFPLIFQIQSAIENFRRAADRSEDISKLLARILELINSYRGAWKETDTQVTLEENKFTRFMFGGWSWQYQRFFIYPIHFNPITRTFRAYTHSKKLKRLRLPKGEKCIVIGNYAAEFLGALQSLIKEKHLQTLDYEPLEILGGMLKTPRFVDRHCNDTFFVKSDKPGAIGGAPQVLKIYRHANYRPIAVRWNDGNGDSRVTLFGRQLFEYEKTLHPIYDFSTGQFHYPLSDVRN